MKSKVLIEKYYNEFDNVTDRDRLHDMFIKYMDLEFETLTEFKFFIENQIRIQAWRDTHTPISYVEDILIFEKDNGDY